MKEMVKTGESICRHGILRDRDAPVPLEDLLRFVRCAIECLGLDIENIEIHFIKREEDDHANKLGYGVKVFAKRDMEVTYPDNFHGEINRRIIESRNGVLK